MNHPTEYKGFQIQKNTESFRKEKLIFFPADQGIDHDFDYCEESFVYMGNCKFVDTLEAAKLLIDEIVPFYVKTYGPFPIGGSPQQNITKFDYLVDAIKFAGRFNGELSVQFTNP